MVLCIDFDSEFPLPLMLLLWFFVTRSLVLLILLLLLLLLPLALLLVSTPIFLNLYPVLRSIEDISPTWGVSFWMAKVIILQVIVHIS